MNILITGGSGFLGRWLAGAATAHGHSVFGIGFGKPHQPELWQGFAQAACHEVDYDRLLCGRRLDAVLHLAGGAAVGQSLSDPLRDFQRLAPGIVRLMPYVRSRHPQARFYLFSSAAVYGNPPSLPVSETMPVRPISPYGIHKAVAESILEHYSRIFGIGVTVFRIFSAYGPGLEKQLMWDVCRKAQRASMEGKQKIGLFGTGNESRDFIYIDDLCRAVFSVMAAAHAQFEVLNVSSGVETTVAHVARRLVDLLHPSIEIEFTGEVPEGDPLCWRADITRLAATGFQPEIEIDEGLRRVAFWFQDRTRMSSVP